MAARAHALASLGVSPVVVLVEGGSDAVVVEAVLRRALGPSASGVDVRVLHGVTNVERELARLEARGVPLEDVCGLCDAAEAGFVERALARRGVAARGEEGLAAYGFLVCTADLEDELLRALGPDVVHAAVEELGEAGRFATFRNQPEWRGRPLADQLHRFAGSGPGRKERLARALAARLTAGSTPPPLAALARHVGTRLAAAP